MNPERWQEVKNLLATALEMSPSERPAYLDQHCAGNPSLRSDVDRLLNHEPDLTTKFLSDTALSAAAADALAGDKNLWIGRRVGPYRIVEQIGAGGMGEVYRAVRADDQYHQQVALKVVRAGHDSDFIVTRFRHERQILAGLDHPNIARLLDGGTTKEGTPYLVMELIDGRPITEYCDTRKLSTSGRLALFLQVCAAVQYAHQRLIIHRDIKPGNILVTVNGVPKLLDFGIAKILDVEGDQGQATLTMYRLLTPQYASPEQVRSEPITTASDVYSLGVVLYELLTGRSPYPKTTGTSQETARAVCEFEPVKPSTAVRPERTPVRDSKLSSADNKAPVDAPEKLAKRLTGDLDNIVLMALRKEPDRRYASVEQFAEDIRRHLTALPVLARKDTARYRASKFVTRHKAAVAAAAVVALILIAGLVITIHEARIAQRRFNDVRELANSLIFDIHDSIRDLPGSTAARKLIVDKALRYLDSLDQESSGDLSLQREIAEGYTRIGDVQGNDFSANLGDTGSALKSYEKALSIRQGLWSARQGNLADAFALAESYRTVSQVQFSAGNLSAALDDGRKAVELLEPIAKDHPNDAKALFQLVAAYQVVANVLGGENSLSSLGDNESALTYRQKQVDAAERWVGLNPADDNAKGNLAIAFSTMGDQLWQDGQIEASLQHYLRSQSMFEDLAAHSRKAARARYLLGLVCERIAQVQLSKGNVDAALVAAQVAGKISAELSSADSRDVQSGVTSASDFRLLADLESRKGNTAQAASDLNQATVLMKSLSDLSPNDIETQGQQADLFNTAGDVASRSQDYSRALKHYEDGTALLSKIVSDNARNAGAKQKLAATYNNVGRSMLGLHNTTGAENAFRKALAISEPVAASNRPDVQALYTTADAYAGLGEVEDALASDLTQGSAGRVNHRQQAVSWNKRSSEMWGRIKEPGAVSPAGFDCVPLASVSRRLSRDEGILAKSTSGVGR